MAEYKTPNNSLAARQPQTAAPQPPKADKVVTGAVSLKEKTKTEKFIDDSKNAIKNVVKDTVAPSIKDMVLNAIWNGLSMIFFPDGSHRPTRGSSPASRVSYYSGYNNYGSYYGKPYQPSVVNAAEPAFRNPILASMNDANAVLAAMRDCIRQYGIATWSTLYDLCGMDSQNWQGTTKYGWTNVESTIISAVHTADGQLAYELRMPKASPIDDMPF